MAPRLRGFKRPPTLESKSITLHYGPPGCGKTRWIYDNWDDWWQPMVGTYKWFDGYDGHERVLFDDFAGARSEAKLTSWLQLLDRYPVRVQQKGSSTWFNPKEIIITSNFKPHEWWDYTGRDVHFKALCRRITMVKEFKEDGTFEVFQGEALQRWLTPVWPIFIACKMNK